MNDSYAKEFADVSDVVRLGTVEKPIGYSVFVGDPDLKYTFLDCGKFTCEDFSTRGDAQNALNLTKQILELVDENLSMGLKLADVRDEVIAAIANTKLKHEDFLAATRAVNEFFDYYIAVDMHDRVENAMVF